ncbi:Uncharacterized protein AArcCO_1872 [Halalkaliarchaeum sp. AArc-CO]|uniref:hypothetical protein n=1 Tax=unclassified Halalkaliarchaeum TaxID=2678344 RepID=UPI00217EA2A9|nr:MULTISPECIES: hypothetical protein [unclassified Halalkaliarchaeum]MDR5671671.1 hypothetical protein [Halalkaliarchaeum sp. AArc-GB]UWG51171.1 Uncharacterized protein AArcCO_1872 [Halalkaliarchaeum sp. AArc-CO]
MTSGDAQPVEQIPDGSELVVHVDYGELSEDPETERLLEAFAEEDPSVEDPAEIEEEFEDELDIDPDDVDTVVAFVDDLEASEQPGEDQFALIAHGEFEGDSVIDAIEDEEGDLEETEHNGHTMFTFEDRSVRGDAAAIASLGEGQVVVGDRQSVEDAIDTSAGDHDALSGDLRDAYDRSTEDGLISVVVDFPGEEVPADDAAFGLDTSVLQSVETMSYEYYTTDGAAGSELRLYTDRAADAEDVNDVISGALVAFGDTGMAELDAEIEKISADQSSEDDTVVVVTYESDLDDIEALLETLP